MRRTYSQEELIERAFLRLAVFLHGLWQEGDNADSRLFEKLIPDAFVKKGMSVRAQVLVREREPVSLHREHVVPCAVLRDCVFKRFHDNATLEEVAVDIRRNLVIVDILFEEARRMDFELNLKSRMPDHWRFESNDPFARLRAAGIDVAKPCGLVTNTV